MTCGCLLFKFRFDGGHKMQNKTVKLVKNNEKADIKTV